MDRKNYAKEKHRPNVEQTDIKILVRTGIIGIRLEIIESCNEFTMALASLEDSSLLRSLGIPDDFKSDSDSDSCESDIEELESDKEEISCDEVYSEDLSNGNGEVEERNTLSPSNIPKPTHADPHLYVSTTAVSNETLLSWLRSNKFNWFALYNDLTLNLRHCGTEVLNEIILNFTEYLNNSTLTDEDKTLAEISRQAFFKYMENKPLSIDGEEVTQWAKRRRYNVETT